MPLSSDAHEILDPAMPDRTAPLRRAVWTVSVLSTIGTVALLWLTATFVTLRTLGVIVGLVGGMGALYRLYSTRRPDPYAGPLFGGLTALLWAGSVAAVAALAALRAGAPLIDDTLARADRVLGLDVMGFQAWIADHPPDGMVLQAAYLTSVPMVVLGVLILGLSRREARMWALCLCFAGCTAVGCFCSVFVPAIGPSVYYGIAPDVQALLPHGAARFYLAIYRGFRSGGLGTIDVKYFEGVVTFPSIHVTMALMSADALRGVRWVFLPVLIWNSMIIVSTLPIGGHYGVDLIGGALVWAVFAWWGRKLEARCTVPGSAPAQPAR